MHRGGNLSQRLKNCPQQQNETGSIAGFDGRTVRSKSLISFIVWAIEFHQAAHLASLGIAPGHSKYYRHNLVPLLVSVMCVIGYADGSREVNSPPYAVWESL